MEDLVRLLGDKLRVGQSSVDTESSVAVDFLLLFFSAHWCGPCRLFKHQLQKFYTEANQSRKLVEVVFVSCDQDAESFEAYFATMPWLAVDYQEKGQRERLGKEFNVTCIPKLVLISREGALRSDTCRGDVENLSIDEVLSAWQTALIGT